MTGSSTQHHENYSVIIPYDPTSIHVKFEIMKSFVTSLVLLMLFWNGLLTAQIFTFDFSQGSQLFTGGVSDFGVNQSEQHQFVFENEALPPPFPPGTHAQYVSGTNPSDDLFMFMKRHITGLQPNTMYEVTFVVEFASIYPTNAIGVGGPPGEGVTMKVGVTLIEPDTMIDGGDVVMNIDKGNQSQPGADMDTIGHVGVSDTTTVYTLKTNHNLSHPFNFMTDSDGDAWFIVGTDSGFESTTAIYYTHITVEFTAITSVDDPINPDLIQVYPNPSSGNIRIVSTLDEVKELYVYDLSGRLIETFKIFDNAAILNLPKGAYVISIPMKGQMVNKKIVIE